VSFFGYSIYDVYCKASPDTTEQSWSNPGAILEQSWSNPGAIILEQSWSNPAAILELFWSNPGAILKNNSGAILEQSWSNSGAIILEQSWSNNSGAIILEQSWSNPGANLEQYRKHCFLPAMYIYPNGTSNESLVAYMFHLPLSFVISTFRHYVSTGP
jgi:hypothetical protein